MTKQFTTRLLATALTATVLTGCFSATGSYNTDDNLITSRTVQVAISNPKTNFDVVRRGKGKQGVDASRPFMGMTISSEQMISDVGSKVLLRDGNAVDAIIAMSFMQAVVRPHVAGLGSQGMCLVNNSKIGLSEVLDFSVSDSHIPTMPRGLAVLHSRYGDELWSDLVVLAEQQARRGVKVSSAVVQAAERTLQGGAVIEGQSLDSDKLLYRDRLSLTLSLLRLQGGGALYTGQGLDIVMADAERLGIPLDKDAVKNYQPTWRTPLSMQAGDYTIYTAGYPSSLGISVAQGLSLSQNLLTDDDAKSQYKAGLKETLNKVKTNAFGAGVSISNTSLMAVDDEGLAVICQPSLNGYFGAGGVSQNLGMTYPQKKSGVASLPLIGVNEMGHFTFMTNPTGNSVTLYDALNTIIGLVTLPEDNTFTDVVNPSRTWTDGKTWFAETADGTSIVQKSGTRIDGVFCPSTLPASSISCSAGVDPRGQSRIRFAGFDSSVVSSK